MVLTRNQCDLLISMFNESIQRAKDSGIPIAVECYEDIEIIKEKLYEEYRECCHRESHNNLWDLNEILEKEEVNRDFD